MGPRTGLHGLGRSRPHRGSIAGPSKSIVLYETYIRRDTSVIAVSVCLRRFVSWPSNWTRVSFLRRVRKTATSYYQLRHVCPSVCPHGTSTMAPTGRTLMKLDF